MKAAIATPLRKRHLTSIAAFAVLVGVTACDDDGGSTVFFDAALPGDAGRSDAAASTDAASVGDAASPTADASNTDADAEAPARGPYVSPTLGADTNPGTMAAPYKTIDKAIKEAKPGETIWLLDGVYAGATEPKLNGSDAAPCGALSGLAVPAGVNLRAVNPGQATLEITAPHALCVNGGAVRDLDLVIKQGNRAIEALAGDTVIHGVKISGPGGCGGSGNEAAIASYGTAKLTIRPGRVADYGDTKVCKWAQAGDQSELTVAGGQFTFSAEGATSGSAQFVSREKGILRLQNVKVVSERATAVTVAGESTTYIDGGELQGNAMKPAVEMRASNGKLFVDKATFKAWDAVVTFPYGYSTKGEVTISKGKLTGGRVGITTGVDSTTTITLDDTELSQLATALAIAGHHTLKVTGGRIVDNTMGGADLQGACKVTMRSVTVTGNAGNGVRALCTAGSTVDLGTLADPGNNVLQNNGAPAQNTANLYVQSAGLLVLAVGNTWNAGAQGATNAGKYEVPDGQTKLEATSGSGTNYNVVAGSVRLAEK